jgi:hypothetical protein
MSKKRKKTPFVLLVLSVLACMVVFFFVSKKAYTVEGNEYYCFCTHSLTTKEEAYEKSSEVIQNGGVGTVWEQGGTYYVIGALYCDAKDADSVARKNDGVVLTLVLPAISTSDKAFAREAMEVYTFVKSNVKQMVDYSIRLGNRQESEAVVSLFLSKYKTSVIDNTGEFYSLLEQSLIQDKPSVALRSYAVNTVICAIKAYSGKDS